MTELLLASARRVGDPGPTDLLVVGDRIAAIAPSGSLDAPGARRIDLGGRFVHPGLWDGHVHFSQWVRRRRRLDLSRTASARDVLDLVAAQALAPGAPPLVGYGFRDALWPDAPLQAELDRAGNGGVVVLVSGDLHCAWISSAAAVELGTTTDASGVLRENDWIGLPSNRSVEEAPGHEHYREAADAAAARGVVGVVEFENEQLDAWPARVAAGVTALRVEAAVWPNRLDEAIAAGRRTGDLLDPLGLIRFGRLKIVVDGSLNTRTAWCHDPYPDGSHGTLSVPPEQLRDLLRRADAHGILPAVHAIGDHANTEVLDAFEELGIAGVVEHAQLVAERDFARFGALGIIASVQPEHAMDDRDAAELHWHGRTDRAFAFASLVAGGAELRLGSDAPVAPLDPWQAIAAGVGRARDGREAWHAEQRIPLDLALAASTRGPLAVGGPADLIVLDDDPFAAGLERLRELPVTATMLGGRWTHGAL